MRKKIFTLFTLMLAVCSGVWADTKPTISGITLPDAPTATLNLSSQNDFTPDENKWIVFSPKADGINSKSYWAYNATNGNDRTWSKPDGATAPFVGGSSKTCYALQTARVHCLRFTGATTFSVLGKSGGTGRYVRVALYTYDGSTFSLVDDKGDNSNTAVELLFSGLNSSTNYVAYFYGSATSNSDLCEVALKAPAGPSISTSGTTSVAATESGVAATTDIAITGYNLTTNGTLTAEFTSSVSGLSVSFGSNTTSIDADGAISTSVTVSYSSTVNVPTGTAYLRISDGTTNKNVAITYSASVTSWTLQSVNTTTTWDWSKITANTTSDKYSSEGIKLTAETTPSSTTEFVMANYDGIDYTIGSDFDGTSVAFKGEYPIRKNQYCQNGIVKINVAVPGKIVVKFSDTGSSASATAVKRYLVVNDEQTEYWTSRENNNSDPEIAYDPQLNVVSGEIAVPAGDVTITGSSAIIINYITFTPTAETVGTASGRNYASYVTTKKLDFASAEGITAYIATGFNGAKNAIVLKEVDVVPAGTPIIVNTTTQGTTVNVPVATGDASSIEGNALVAGDGTTAWDGTAGYTYYYLAGDEMHKATSGTLQSGKAYLKVLTSEVPTSARDLGFVFEDDATGINMVQNSRITENGEYYNLNGQRIAQPTKGLYIVNGKKVVIK